MKSTATLAVAHGGRATGMKVADQAWIAAALLHREHPDSRDFSLQEILQKARSEFRTSQPGVWQHIVSHGVAQNPATPNRARLFTITERGRRRLYRPGDKCNPDRASGKTHPDRNSVDDRYWELIDWYERNYAPAPRQAMGSRSGGDSRPEAYLAFVGIIPAYDLNEMSKKIEAECERIENETGE